MNQAPARWIVWGQLVRLPNVFTVIADVGAAFLLVAGEPSPPLSLILVILAGISLYWAGMILNDIFDLDRDRQQRSKRPLPAGQISLSAAHWAAWLLMVCGITIGFACGQLPGLMTVLLAAAIVAYDGPLKATWLGPVAMGVCRLLSFTLGAAAAATARDVSPLPLYVWGIATGFGVYVMGITTMARHEATGGQRPVLATGLAITVLGILLLALTPRFSAPTADWHVDPNRIFPLLIGLIGLPVVMRAWRALQDPLPRNIQHTIRSGILSIIPLAGCFALLGSGTLGGLAILSLLIPTRLLATRFRVT
jgi:4-hydroxybenzoate polyprenyltransferase